MNILKKDEKFFDKNMSHTKLVEYYKTKDNSLRIAIFENREFVAFETSKANNIFKETVLDVDERYKLSKQQQIVKKDGSLDITQYFGTIKNI